MKEFDVKTIPASITQFILDNDKRGFHFCLVGGYVRDWALGIESFDYDFEIRHSNMLKGDEWIEFLKESFPDAEYIGMGVIRIKLPDYEIELSSPRTESFNGELDHKNFTPHFDSTLSYKESFKRRDLRINAIGLEFKVVNGELNVGLIDPYDGLSEIKRKVCTHISDDFFQDPVRLLRAIRFSLNTGFELGLSDSYKKFNLSKLTEYYFDYEASKCKRPRDFIFTFVSTVKKYDIALVKGLSTIKNYLGKSLLSEVNSYEDELLYDIGLTCDGVYQFLSMKRSRYVNLCRLKISYQKLSKKVTREDSVEFLEYLSKLKTTDNFRYFTFQQKLCADLKAVRSKEDRLQIFDTYFLEISALFA